MAILVSVKCLCRFVDYNLKEIVLDNSPNTNIGLNNIQERSTIESQELTQPFHADSERLRLVTEHSYLSNNIAGLCLSDHLYQLNDPH